MKSLWVGLNSHRAMYNYSIEDHVIKFLTTILKDKFLVVKIQVLLMDHFYQQGVFTCYWRRKQQCFLFNYGIWHKKVTETWKIIFGGLSHKNDSRFQTFCNRDGHTVELYYQKMVIIASIRNTFVSMPLLVKFLRYYCLMVTLMGLKQVHVMVYLNGSMINMYLCCNKPTCFIQIPTNLFIVQIMSWSLQWPLKAILQLSHPHQEATVATQPFSLDRSGRQDDVSLTVKSMDPEGRATTMLELSSVVFLAQGERESVAKKMVMEKPKRLQWLNRRTPMETMKFSLLLVPMFWSRPG